MEGTDIIFISRKGFSAEIYCDCDAKETETAQIVDLTDATGDKIEKISVEQFWERYHASKFQPIKTFVVE